MIETSADVTTNALSPSSTGVRVGRDGRALRAREEPEVRALLDGMLKLVREGQARRAVRMLLETTDGWMHAGQLASCRDLLRVADADALGVTVALGLLTALDPVRDAMREERGAFISRFRAYVESVRPADCDELLRGVR